jgi:hypothetical protein
MKRLDVASTLIYRAEPAKMPPFKFSGPAVLALGAPRPPAVLEQKLERGGLAEEIDYMRARERAAEAHLLEDAIRRPDNYPALLAQLEEIVLGECSEAHLRARQGSELYGPAMLIEVQDRLRELARSRPEMIGGHTYECLIGMAGLLTADCRVWWSARFPVVVEERDL